MSVSIFTVPPLPTLSGSTEANIALRASHHKNSVSGKPPSFKRWMETTRRAIKRSQKNVLLLINNLKSRLNGLLVGESSGNWHRKRGLLLYTYYGTVLAMWLFA
ncbi:MAG: hypothetical protein F6K23_14755 [Okeania sp. SIO2C9]|uniref:hypothetical protein n=1 Tax=Okeania sp. SIO2C9 TaxID=2607791 RepID=UPI0013BF4E18|nr:hypothetical protein [Okeania sp. SIO2C9]NEQ74183.1 hypothetical protein [Okeania sp. SIO2C9]